VAHASSSVKTTPDEGGARPGPEDRTAPFSWTLDEKASSQERREAPIDRFAIASRIRPPAPYSASSAAPGPMVGTPGLSAPSASPPTENRTAGSAEWLVAAESLLGALRRAGGVWTPGRCQRRLPDRLLPCPAGFPLEGRRCSVFHQRAVPALSRFLMKWVDVPSSRSWARGGGGVAIFERTRAVLPLVGQRANFSWRRRRLAVDTAGASLGSGGGEKRPEPPPDAPQGILARCPALVLHEPAAAQLR
jgi:hypothetical protein